MRILRAMGILGVAASLAAADGPTYHEHVEGLLQAHCAVCHRPGQSAPFPLLTLEDARKHGREIADVTGRRFMPPWLPAPQEGGFVGERRLTDEAIRTLGQWVADGMPEGDPVKAPVPRVWTGDWPLGKPDLIVRMPESYRVPAAGRDVYRHFVIPVPVDRARYVAAWEFRPHSRAVHHAFLRLDRTGEARRRDAADPEPGFPGMDTPAGINSPNGHFASWQPGASPRQNPPGLPWILESGSDVVLQMHLQTLGKPDPLQAEVGFYFTDQPPTNQPVKVALVSYAIDLAPGATNTVVTDDFVVPADADLLGILPHTHYLGKRVEARATLPDGTGRSLLLIPSWDFNWQGDYIYRQPVFLPAGTRVEMRVSFDNSAANPRNPSNPPRRVRFGLNTTDEMAELWLQLLPRSAAGATAFNRSNLDRAIRDTLAYNGERLRVDPKDGAAHVNLGRALLGLRRQAEAKSHFVTAVQVAPDLDDGHYYMGLMHRLEGDTVAAAAEFQSALRLNPGNARAHGNLGMIDVDGGRFEAAAVHFEAAIRLDATDALAHATLGAIRLQQNRPEEARPLLERAAALDPDNPDVKQNLKVLRQRAP